MGVTNPQSKKQQDAAAAKAADEKAELAAKGQEGSAAAAAALVQANEQQITKAETAEASGRNLGQVVILTGYQRYNSPLGLMVYGQEYDAGDEAIAKKLCKMKNDSTGERVFTMAEDFYEDQENADDAPLDLNMLAGKQKRPSAGGIEEV